MVLDQDPNSRDDPQMAKPFESAQAQCLHMQQTAHRSVPTRRKDALTPESFKRGELYRFADETDNS